MDKQDPAARGANPGASQLSHPAMKQSADFIETRSPASSRSRCSSRFVTSSGPRELPGAARGAAEDDRGDAAWPSSPSQPCPRSQRAHICFQKRWIEALPRSGGAGLEPAQLPRSPAHHFTLWLVLFSVTFQLVLSLYASPDALFAERGAGISLPWWGGVQGRASTPRAQPHAHTLAGTGPAPPTRWGGRLQPESPDLPQPPAASPGLAGSRGSCNREWLRATARQPKPSPPHRSPCPPQDPRLIPKVTTETGP